MLVVLLVHACKGVWILYLYFHHVGLQTNLMLITQQYMQTQMLNNNAIALLFKH